MNRANLTFWISQSCRLVVAGAFLIASSAMAHKASDSYLTVDARDPQLHGEWHLALRDLQDAIGLDSNEDGMITWLELRSQEAAVNAYAATHLRFAEGQQAGRIEVRQLLVENHSDGAYAVLRFDVSGLRRAEDLQIDYRAFFDLDPLHRGLLRHESDAGIRLAVFSPQTACQHFGWNQAHPRSLAFVREGVWHIWTGYDHILFLLALLLPGALRRGAGGWEPEASFRVVLMEVLRTVTAFTLAHSITLSLAVFGWVQLPPRLVESVIAASVVIAATNNLLPLRCRRAWLMAFGFGLMHGFGFASALTDLGLHGTALAGALVEFNLGVEAGQMVIVGIFLPLLFSVRQWSFYPRVLLPLASSAIVLIAGAWFTERLLDIRWLNF